jgi:GH24 family phage-related lysozyme (muramidase)
VNIERLKKQIIESEGLRYRAYQDHLGNWTIGVGHLLKSRCNRFIAWQFKIYEAHIH